MTAESMIRIGGALCVALITACSNSESQFGGGGSGGQRYDVEVKRGSFGVPHFVADDYGSIGYGYGYVQAQDNLCIIAEDMITTKGERAKHFGRNGTYTIHANGNTSNNVDSDFFWRHVVTEERISNLDAAASPEAKAATQGYADGYSRYVREVRAGMHAGRHQRCRDAGCRG